ncbi:Histidine biosynthesis bifunctional protein hisB [Coemansia sp. RSA 486]|nr:Histidine biosynthesis bifunctional protein hisB [Coemansia sp. RSA 486]
MTANGQQQKLYLLDYGAGNVRSLVNAIERLGYHIEFIQSAADFDKADKVIFPGVGAFGYAIQAMHKKGYMESLRSYIASGRPLMGICVGMQVLFDGSEESPEDSGLGIFEGRVALFNSGTKTVPHIGWNAAQVVHADDSQPAPATVDGERFYFVHSYAVPYTGEGSQSRFVHTATRYSDETIISSVWKGNVFATQFHPEKSGSAGLALLKSFIQDDLIRKPFKDTVALPSSVKDTLSVRVIACLDVRTNDSGDLVVTKGDQYDVRENSGEVRNLGKPVDLAARYFTEGADEITFLNITSFRDCPFADTPMLEVLRQTSRRVFVPLTIGGGVRDVAEPDGSRVWPAVDVAGEYFRSGADKVSIGSDAVYAAERYWQRAAAGESPLDGSTAIEQIAERYGRQAVVISVDPRRVYVNSPEDAPNHHVIETAFPGPEGQRYCWYQCTVKGGREPRDTDVRQLVTACQAMGAGEILLNCMDKDGTNSGYDIELIKDTKAAVSIPVIASSGAGCPEHFSQAVEKTNVDAVLAAGIFHRREVPIEALDNKIYTLLLQNPNGVDNDVLSEGLRDCTQEEIVNGVNRLLQANLLELMQVGNKIMYRGVSTNELERMAGLTSDEKLVYKHIENSRNEGIWVRTLKQKTNLLQSVINRCLKGLEQKALIKSVKSVKHPTRKLYMLIDVTPSSDITGGPWYTDQEMDTDFIDQLANQCYQFIYMHSFPRHNQQSVYSAHHTGYPTSSQIKRYIVDNRITSVDLSTEHIEELLTMLVYDGKIEKVAPAFNVAIGAGASRQKPDWMYRALRLTAKDSAFTDIPCGRCPVFDRCGDTGPVTPAKCEYFQKWLTY